MEDFYICPDLKQEELRKLKILLQKHRRCFAFSTKEMGKVKDTLVVIDTGDHPPVFKPPFRQAPAQADEIDRQVQEAVEQGIMSPAVFPYNSPVFLVSKKDGTWRMVVDFRALNQQCVQNTYPIPRVDEVFDRLTGSSIYASLDAMAGFWQLELSEESK